MSDPTRINIDFDPLSRRMKGVATHGMTPFDVPLISQIEEDLWQGGCEEGLKLPPEVRHVISLYPWEQYRHDGVLDTVIQIRMLDSAGAVDGRTIDWLATAVNRCLSMPGATLVHCQAGLNRSSLVAARSFMLRAVDPLTADEAIALVRSSRSPACLCNPSFEEWLRLQ